MISVRRASPYCVLECGQFLPDDLAHQRLVPENGLEPRDEPDDLFVLVLDLLPLQLGQALQPQIQDGLRLNLAHAELAHQAAARLVDGAGAPDELNDGVQVVQGDTIPLQDMGARLRLAQLVSRPPDDDHLAVVDEVADDLLQVEDPGLVVHQRQHDHAEGGLHRRVLVERVQDGHRGLVLLQLQHDPHPFPVRFVSQVRDPFDLLLADQLGDLVPPAWPC